MTKLTARESLSEIDAEQAMWSILEGRPTTAQIAAFLAALKTKGETADELTGFARVMRGKANKVTVKIDGPLVDTCGTGGDASGTINISTIAAFVVAGAGVAVAKHGNRSVSSRFGSADLMEALGVRIAMTPEESARAIETVGIGFLFAPAIHPAMKHAAAARQELRMRTAFNLLGPLTNPAGAKAQVVGAPSLQAAALMAESLERLGLKRGLVVHGSDGLDEITTTGPTTAWRVGAQQFTLTPEEFGVPRATIEQLRGDPLQAAQAVLSGELGPWRDIVLVNSAAALVTAGVASNWKDGVAQAAASIDSGAARAKVDALRAI
ncbi:MAG: anthranilate phosphoribosyltransferase [Acidobacteria bacterium]|nr:anthranilate phosphoribosyltransferase [Acidobacteriota bacterium]